MTYFIIFVVRKKFYAKEDNIISPPLKLGSELISEKTCFHTMEYGSNNLSNSVSFIVVKMVFDLNI